MKWAYKQTGFTIVELLIVIVVIAILAAITVVAYNGVQNQARQSIREADMTTYYKAILAAREAKGGLTLRTITGSNYSAGNCAGSGNPKDLPKTDACWVRYYDNLDKIGAAAGIDLSGLRDGDADGNPYVLDENEGETCGNDIMYYYTANGVRTEGRIIPRLRAC